MDVARFKYPPHWVPLQDVVDAMLHVDPASGLPRGFLQLGAHPPVEDPQHSIKPLHVPYVPRAAGRGLSRALVQALSTPQVSILEKSTSCNRGRESWASGAICRWLQAASTAEPQVLRTLFQVGDAIALSQVLDRLRPTPFFRDLLEAYTSLIDLGLVEDFPRLRFASDGDIWSGIAHGDETCLNTCGELWVLLLLLLPHHLRGMVAEELAPAWVRDEAIKAVRGPWALPLAAFCEALDQLLQPPGDSCNSQSTK
jgi:hypothetical protein